MTGPPTLQVARPCRQHLSAQSPRQAMHDFDIQRRATPSQLTPRHLVGRQHGALAAYWALLHGLLEQVVGVPRGSVDGLPRLARAAGLEVVAVNGTFATMEPEVGFDLHADTLAAARERGVASGAWTGDQVDTIVNDLRAAKAGNYEWVSTPFYLDLTLRKPLAR